MGAAINWYTTNGWSGNHSGTPTIFMWPGDYSAETSTIQIPSNTTVNVQLSTGTIVNYSANPLFHLNSASFLNITGNTQASPLRTIAAAETGFLGASGVFLSLDALTQNSSVNISSVQIKTIASSVLSLQPGATGAGDCEIYIDNCKIDNAQSASAAPAIITDGPIYLGVDNSAVISQRGSASVGTVHHFNGRVSISNSTVWNKGVNSSESGPNMIVDIGNITSTDTGYYLQLTNTQFYSSLQKGRPVIYDQNGASTGTFGLFMNSICTTNQLNPQASGTGTYIVYGPGTFQISFMREPLW
jgi:hypothetical protein